MSADKNPDVIDMAVLGALMRRRREQIGIRRGADFINILKKYTGADISLQTLYGIEQGKVEPRLSVFLAMMRVLFHDQPQRYDKFLQMSLPGGWDESLDLHLMKEDKFDEFKFDMNPDTADLPF